MKTPKILVDNGANIYAGDYQGITPFSMWTFKEVIPYDYESQEKIYEGSFTQKHPFTMHLRQEGTVLSGYYFYNKIKTKIILSGSVDKYGQFILMESVKDKETGAFFGVLKEKTLKGEWFKDANTDNQAKDFQARLKEH